MIPPILIRLLFSTLIALGIGRLIIKQRKSRQPIEGRVLNAIWPYFLGVKLSLLFTQWSAITTEPMLLFYGWGGNVNTAVGLAAVGGYLSFFILKKSVQQRLDSIFTVSVAAAFLGGFLASGFFFKPSVGHGQLVLSDLAEEMDLHGVPLQIQDGQPVILNFWATWCAPCRAEMPELEAFYRAHPTANFFTFNNIESESGGVAGVKVFLEQKGYEFPVVTDQGNGWIKAFEVSSFPTTLVFDADGQLIHKTVGVVSRSTLESFVK